MKVILDNKQMPKIIRKSLYPRLVMIFIINLGKIVMKTKIIPSIPRVSVLDYIWDLLFSY